MKVRVGDRLVALIDDACSYHDGLGVERQLDSSLVIGPPRHRKVGAERAAERPGPDPVEPARDHAGKHGLAETRRFARPRTGRGASPWHEGQRGALATELSSVQTAIDAYGRKATR